MTGGLRVRVGSLVALSVLVMAIGGSAGAATIFSTFGPGDSYDAFGGRSVTGPLPGWFTIDQDVADRFIFSGTQSYTLDSIELALAPMHIPETETSNVMDVWLMSDVLAFPDITDVLHRPGDIIEALTVDVSGGQGILTANSALHPVLAPDTNYWIGMSIASGEVGTLYSLPVVPGWVSYRSDLGDWLIASIFDTTTLDAFRINGTPVEAGTVAVPVPGAILLGMMGTGLIATLRRRRML